MLRAGAIALQLLAALHGAVDHGIKLRAAGAERIERAGLDQAFEHAPVQQARVDGVAELEERVEAAQLLARFENAAHRIFADVLDGAHAEANLFADGREVHVAGVDVRRKHGDAHAARFVDVLHHFFGVAGFRSQQRGHEFDRIVRLEPGRLIGQQRVGAGVRFVEAVAGEFGHQIENALGLFRRNFVRGAAGQEFLALRGHLVAILLAHGAAQDVGFAEREAGQAIGDLHHLLLIEDDAVGLFQDLLQLGQVVGDFFLAVLAGDEIVDHAALDRARGGRAR